MHIRSRDFRVAPKQLVDLGKWPTLVPRYYSSKEDYRARISEHVAKLSDAQDRFYANHRHALLLIFQAMDAAGKDGAIKHVMSGVNPQGCEVVSFKHPSAEELDHDFLWRTTRRLPAAGMIGIFNRSYYEEVLILRVHPALLRAQNLPPELVRKDTLWPERYRSILDLEAHLARNGTKILKFFLHLSKAEQRKRFLKRIERADKHWKFSAADMHERKFWSSYMSAYEACLGATSTAASPWYVVPADDKHNGRLIVSEIILEAFGQLKLRYPPTTRQRRKELAQASKEL